MEELIKKLRDFIQDTEKKESQVFIYSNFNSFNFADLNVSRIIDVLVNNTSLRSGDGWDWDSDLERLTIDHEFSKGDVIEVYYGYYKYSETELTSYISKSLGWISLLGGLDQDFEVQNGDIYPTPANIETDLIALIAAVLIEPNFTSYRTPEVSITYPNKKSKEDKIQDIINKYRAGSLGVFSAE